MSDETTKNPQEEEAIGKAYDSRLARRLARYLGPYRWRVVLAIGLLIVSSVVELAGPLLTARAVDLYIPSGDAYHLNIIAALYVGLLFASFGLTAAQTYLMQMLGQYVQFDLRREIFGHLQRIDVAHYDKNPVGRLITRLTSDVDALNELFTSGFVAIFGDVFTLAGITIVLFVYDWRLACVALVILPGMLMVTAWFRRGAREGFRKVRTRIARINAFLQEHVTGMAVVQLFGREKIERERFDTINDEHRVANIETIFYYAVFFPAIEIISSCGIALIIWYGGSRVLAGFTTIGALIAFIQYAQRFYQPIRDLSDKYNILQGAMAASERIFRLLDEQPEILTPAAASLTAATEGGLRSRGRIEFRNVWFAYKDEEWVLKDVSFVVEPGQSVGIVGHTGAGKTTLTNLLLRFYDIQKGRILLDGVDVRDYDLQSLRRNFSIVLQDVYLFSGSVQFNVTLGNPDIDAGRVEQAAREVHADEFIRRLPEGYETRIHERGAGLSVGQKQLISFARALAYDPPILILDEATSSIDSETEMLIRDAVTRLMQGRTSVIIAHRLSTIQSVDKIIVLHKGELRESGTHQELLALRGLYFRLYQLQYKDQETGSRTPITAD
ncbi:MAG TPA: ABC transporter ATP-binding protein [Blastocatellia bacterium]|nr:ABC transporter ATP-binding protein [Blastocatellia bacterium]